MADFFEIDFLDVESDKSGDAIPLRYRIGEQTLIHVVDGGFQDTGAKVVEHIRKYYDNPTRVDHVVVTHPDGDHAGGLRTVLESFQVGCLWMLRPWMYASELLPRFSRFTSVENLQKRLKEIYPNLAALEEIAVRRGIAIREPFQGSRIGAFTVLAPAKPRYLDLVVNSEKTPESVAESERTAAATVLALLEGAGKKAATFIKAAWGVEVFSPNETSAENDMSVVQFAQICSQRILLTGDAGRSALKEAAVYAPRIGLRLPGIDRFQVPHHGSRRNVSSEVLDLWLGPKLPAPLSKDGGSFTAIISSAKKDEAHPRKSVVRALYHRGGNVYKTEGKTQCTSVGAPSRAGWTSSIASDYPAEQEE